ncbi:hypothetical protein ACA910_001892 [Epithemia clementina (nom. ined.)]
MSLALLSGVWTQKISDLEAEVNKLSTQLSNGAVRFAGLGFTSVEEVKAWQVKHFGCHAYGLVYNVFLFLENLAAKDKQLDQTAMLMAMEKRLKLKIKTVTDARALQAFGSKVPRLLYNGMIPSAPGALFLTNAPKYANWCDRQTGVHDGITASLGKVFITAGKSIHLVCQGYSADSTKSVMLEALSNTATFRRALVGNIDQTMDELTGISKFTDKKAWGLVSRIVYRSFCEINEV